MSPVSVSRLGDYSFSISVPDSILLPDDVLVDKWEQFEVSEAFSKVVFDNYDGFECRLCKRRKGCRLLDHIWLGGLGIFPVNKGISCWLANLGRIVRILTFGLVVCTLMRS